MANDKKKEQTSSVSAAPASSGGRKADASSANLQKARAYKEPAQSQYLGSAQRNNELYTNAIKGTSAQKYWNDVRSGGGSSGQSTTSAQPKKKNTLQEINDYLKSGETTHEKTSSYLEEANGLDTSGMTEREQTEWYNLKKALEEQDRNDLKREKRERNPLLRAFNSVVETGKNADPNAGFITDPVTQANVDREKPKTPEQIEAEEKQANDAKELQGQTEPEQKEGLFVRPERATPEDEGVFRTARAEEYTAQNPFGIPEPQKPSRAEYDAALKAYQEAYNNDVNAAPYVTDPNDPEYQKILQARTDAANALKSMNQSLGFDTYEGMADEERARDMTGSFIGERGSGVIGSVGAALNWFDSASDDMTRYEYDQEHGEGAWDRAVAENPELENYLDLGETGTNLMDSASGMESDSAQQWNDALRDLSEGEQYLANTGKGMAHLALDLAENFFGPKVGTARMYSQAAGGRALEQYRKGGSEDEVAVAAVTGAVNAWLTEKLAGGTSNVYGKSVLGELSEKVISRLPNWMQRGVKAATSGAGESIEEGLERLMNTMTDKILNLDPEAQMDWNETAQECSVAFATTFFFTLLTNGAPINVEMLDKVANGSVEAGIDVAKGADPAEVRATALENSQDKMVVKLPDEDTTNPDVNDVIQEVNSWEDVNPETNTETQLPPEQQTVRDILMNPKGEGGKLSNSQIRELTRTPEIYNAFLQLTGAQIDATSNSKVRNGMKDAAERYLADQNAQDAAREQVRKNDEVDRIVDEVNSWEEESPAEAQDVSDKAEPNRSRPGEVITPETVQNEQDQEMAESQNTTLEGQEENPEPVQATETAQDESETQEGVNSNPETENAPEGELNAQEPQEEQTAPDTETNPDSKPAKQKTGKKRVTNSGKPDENTESNFDALVAKNGPIKKGENPARDINVPTKDTNGLKVGNSVRTIFEAAATPEERIASLKAAVVNGDFGHVTVTNKERSEAAAAKIAKDGWKRSVSDFLAAVEAGKSDAETIALGAHLLNEAGNSPEASGRDYIELAMAYNEAGRRAGQGLVANRILKTLTPEGKLYGFEKTVEKINREIKKTNEKKSGKKQKPEVKLDEKLVEDYLNAKTEEERNKTWDKMAKNVAEQVPNTLRDKFTALRYLNMLGNFKTQVRNVMGNVGMSIVQKTKNEVVSGLEGIASKLTGGEYERMYKGFYGTDLHKAAMEDFGSDEDLQKVAKGEAKYSDVGKQAMEAIQDKRDPFSNKWFGGKALNLYSKATNKAMEVGDLIFVRANYADALAGYMNAHKISAADWKAMVADPSRSAEVDKARNYAIKQAQEATFRDTNAVSKFVSGIDKNAPKPVKAVTQGILPFRKTPANVMVRMEEYSPLGVANTIVKAVQAKKGTASVNDAIDSAAKTLTGSGLVALGWVMRSMGWLRSKDDDEKEENIAKLRGQQDYSVEFTNPITGNRVSYTLDWLTPASASLFMGSELFNLVEDGRLTLADAGAVLTTLTNPMMETSMLSGVNDALDNLSDFEGDNSALVQMVLNSAWSYLTQGTSNTLLGQMEQFSEKYRQTYYTDKDNPFIGPSLQKKIAKLGNKTPGFDYHEADYIDAWGRKQENDQNLLTRAFNTFINPGYVSDMDKKATEANDVIETLMQFGKSQTTRDDFPNVVPKTPSRNTTVNGTKLTPEEYEVYATTKGQAQLDAVTEFANSDLFNEMGYFSAAETVSDIYSYASFLAASRVAEMRGEDYYDDTFSPLVTGRTKDGESTFKDPIREEDVPEYLAYKAAYDSALKDKDYDAVDILLGNISDLPASARTGAEQHADKMGTLADLRKAGMSSSAVYYQFQDGMKGIYEGEKRTAPKSSDYIREAGSGKYSEKDADAIMNYETTVSEKSTAKYKDQVRYNLEQAGMGGSYREVWNMVQSVADGDMTRDEFKSWVNKNVPVQYQQAIKDVSSNYSEDRHVAGKQVSGIYRAARAAGSSPEEALEFYNMIDTNYNGYYTKKELDAAVRNMYGNSATARQVRAMLKESIGK